MNSTIGTLPLGGIIALFAGVLLAAWYFVVAYKYGTTLTTFANTRGVNVSGKNKQVTMKCDTGKVICVYRATQVCSTPGYMGKNFETPSTDPISNGLDGGGGYGEYNKNTTVALTKSLGDKCNGKGECSFTFTGDGFPFTCRGEPQLIGSYTCIPEGTVCTASP